MDLDVQQKESRSSLESKAAAALLELRIAAPELVTELLQLEAAIAAMDAVAKSIANEYNGFRKPLDAIEAFLDKRGKPTPRRTIAKMLEQGGFARDQVQHPFWNVLSVIEYHLTRSKSAKRLVEINGLIGKIDWPEDMFVTSDSVSAAIAISRRDEGLPDVSEVGESAISPGDAARTLKALS
jgi:hypothetical protein